MTRETNASWYLLTVTALLVTASAFATRCDAREGARSKSEDPIIARVKSLYESGLAHYNLSEYRDALQDFKEAYRLKADPAFLFNVGQCYRMMKDPENAVNAYRAYLRSSPNAPNRRDVDDFMREADAAIAARDKEAAAAGSPLRLPETSAATANAPEPSHQPPRQRKWLWPVVGTSIGVVVVGAAVGLGVGVSQGNGAPGTSLGGAGVHF